MHADIYDKFVARCAELAKERTALAGDPFDAKTVHTAQIDEDQFKKILNYIDLGKKEGAQLVVGGERIGDKGTRFSSASASAPARAAEASTLRTPIERSIALDTD